ncbi:MAG: PspC domain-containing protein [Microthrixaceae bacterium]
MQNAYRAQLDRVLHLPTRLTRSPDNRVLTGVCGGLGAGLGVDPTVLRLALVVLTLANGAGVVVYLVALASMGAQPPASLAPADPARPATAERAVGVGLVTVGAILLFGHLGALLPAALVWSSAVAAIGLALVWTHVDEVHRTRALLIRVAGGGLLVVVGLAFLFASGGVLTEVGQLGLAVLATGVGVVLLLGPWIMRLLRDLAVERRERIRSEERSEIAAHLHDSVLQTLAMIQRADAPGRARTLARRQERELRAWLFDERPPDGEGSPVTLAAALEQMVTEVEDRHDVELDLVAVGDCPMETRLEALVAAVREAASNSARHAGVDDVSVYVEVGPERVEAYVRDRGRGFDVAAVAPGRVGVRESIVGRMTRHGGKAEVHSTVGNGTEVVLEIGRTPNPEATA